MTNVESTVLRTLRREGIVAAIGNTPLVELIRLFPDQRFRVFGKLEMLNPAGSIKDRTALNVLLAGFEAGTIGPDTTIIESTSGNLGIGLAQLCRRLDLRLICVVDTRITATNRAILEAYGAIVDVINTPDPETGDMLTARINRVKVLCRTIPGAYWINQYANLANPAAHHQTMTEIDTALPGGIDYLFVATSTCGTLRGCAEYVRKHGWRTRIIAVDAAGSVIFGQPSAYRLIPGHGSSRVPELYVRGLEDDHVHVTDIDCVRGCHRLLRDEAILAGGSSGAIVAAIAQYQEQIADGATCVAVLCDRGERYLDTIYSRDWVEAHFGPHFDVHS
jgi:N-(2-amino-2-carboxyethyl)-L-glutamate synthase